MNRKARIGGVYSVVRAESSFGVVKVISHQPEQNAIYARTFGPAFKVRPEAEWFENREPGSLDEELGVGIGALPVTPRVFEFWEPVLLFSLGISEAEQEDLGYCFGKAHPWDEMMYA